MLENLPELTDANFSQQIASQPELASDSYDGTIHTNFKEYADLLASTSVKLAPYQRFVRRFLSHSTPYKSLLVFHGVGTGKTVTATGVCEDFQNYNRNTKNGREYIFIVVVCPRIMMEHFQKGIRDKTDYFFLDYSEFAEFLKENKSNIIDKNYTSGLIVIDEIQNLPVNTKETLLRFVEESKRPELRFLFLSATPIYESPAEILLFLNIMRTNDERGKVTYQEIFTPNGDFLSGVGKKTLLRKATGYVSFVRGENPYTFPFRIYPKVFAEDHTFFASGTSSPFSKKMIPFIDDDDDNNNMNHSFSSILDLFLLYAGKCTDNVGSCSAACCQTCIYKQIMTYLRKTQKRQLRRAVFHLPLHALIMTYPDVSNHYPQEPKYLTGKHGLHRLMHCANPPGIGDFVYKESTLKDMGRIFSKAVIGKYSAKILHILQSLYQQGDNKKKSEGIILIHSNFIYEGLIPVALALEEEGFVRYPHGDGKNLFAATSVVATPPSGSYAFITGDIRLSPNNEAEYAAICNETNKDGREVKVILISSEYSDGMDYKNIRQVHILDPYKNMNRIEQIIGRAVRQFSHKELPFEKRNVQIFLYTCMLKKNKSKEEEKEEETADLFIYRLAESNAIKIGKVTRALKECAVDCLLHHDQTNFTEERLSTLLDEPITQQLSTGQVLDHFKIGDAAYSSACDFMKDCNYNCYTNTVSSANQELATTNANFGLIKKRIREIMKDHFILNKQTFLHMIQASKDFPYEDIMQTIQFMLNNPNETFSDMVGNKGYLGQVHEMFFFIPLNKKKTNFQIKIQS